LIDHVRRLDGFKDEDLMNLKSLLTGLAKKMNPSFSFNDPVQMKDLDFRRFIEITLKIHQIFALVDVNYETVFPAASSSSRASSIQNHFREIAEQLSAHNGLNYVPRERSSNGRVFEHAADSRVLIDQLVNLPDAKVSMSKDNTYYVKIIDEPQSKDSKMPEEESNMNEIAMANKFQSQIMKELSIQDDNIILTINKPFIQLTMKANGKADLYFHAYFVEKYLRSLYVLQDKVGSGGSSKAKVAKKAKKSQRADGEDNLDDDNQSGTRLDEVEEPDFSLPPG